MTVDGIEYIQVIERHYKSCDGCAFESLERKNICKLTGTNIPPCEHHIWIKKGN